MKQKLIILTIVIFSSLLAIGQQNETVYYNAEWKGCSKRNAEFYRICSFNKDGIPVGEIKDYYITGELQATAEGALSINKDDDSKSIFIGTLIEYYKSKKKSFISNYNQKGELISKTSYWENGTLKYSLNYKNGAVEGPVTFFYENGKIARQFKYSNGNLIDTAKYYYKDGKIEADVPIVNGVYDTINKKRYYYDDDDGRLMMMINGYVDEGGNITGKIINLYPSGDTIIFYKNKSNLFDKSPTWFIYKRHSKKEKPYAEYIDYFRYPNNSLWQLTDDDNASVKIQNNQLVFHFHETGFFRKTYLIQTPKEVRTNEFEITTIIAKESNSLFGGILFGYKDINNYSIITVCKQFKTVSYERHENGIIVDEQGADNIQLSDNSDNEVRLIKKNNRIKIFFNGIEGYEIDEPRLSGDLVGLCAGAAVKGEEAIFNFFKINIGEQPSAGFEDKNFVKLKMTGGIYSVPVELNGVLKIDFIFDSGASDVSISPDIAMTLVKTGTIKEADWLPGAYYTFADGSVAKSARFKLKSLKIGNTIVKDIVCSISNSIDAPMLLGQSALIKFGKYTFDSENQILILK